MNYDHSWSDACSRPTNLANSLPVELCISKNGTDRDVSFDNCYRRITSSDRMRGAAINGTVIKPVHRDVVPALETSLKVFPGYKQPEPNRDEVVELRDDQGKLLRACSLREDFFGPEHQPISCFPQQCPLFRDNQVEDDGSPDKGDADEKDHVNGIHVVLLSWNRDPFDCVE